MVPLRIVVPLSQLAALVLFDIEETNEESHQSSTAISLVMSSALPLTRPAWQDRLATLPGSPDHIPAFFFAHASPIITFPSDPPNLNPQVRALLQHGGKESPVANFLRDFGPALLAKYKPKGILVFSAHWEAEGEQLGGFLSNIPA